MITSGHLVRGIGRCHSHLLPEMLTLCNKYNQGRRVMQLGCPALCFSSTTVVSNIMENRDKMQNLKFHNTNTNKIQNPKSHAMKEVYIPLTDPDPDTFGNLGSNRRTSEEVTDEGDIEEEKYLEQPPSRSQQLSTKEYATIIKEFFSQKKIADAIDVLETRMIKADRIKPENYIYNLIIGECGRLGYTKKAFQLYNQMKKRDLKVTGATYTGLFNACANSPWREDGLKRAKHLRELIIEKGHELNAHNYHAMIKAFGRCGDLSTAFSLVDEMRDQQLTISDETFNFLFHACISDKEAGFRHALLVWRKMRNCRVRPDVFSYNLLLRSIRDCGLGDLDTAHNVIHQIIEESQKKALAKQAKAKPMLEAGYISLEEKSAKQNLMIGESTTSESKSNEVMNPVISIPLTRPNLLAAQPKLGNIVGLSEVTKPEDRLFLVGGCSGLLEQMMKDKVKPNIKTFTQLLDNIPSTTAAEKALLSAIKKEGVAPDIDFFNMLIKKRSMRFDYMGAREVLKLIQLAKVHPDIVTFGVLALSCKTYEEAQQLISDMQNSGYRMNAEILGAMLRHGCVAWNFQYVLSIMEIMIEERVRPNEKFMQHLENFYNSCQEKIKHRDTDLPGIPKGVSSRSFKNDFKKFSSRYKSWLEEVEPEKPGHPWEQFRKKREQPKEDSRSKPRSRN